MNKLFKPIYLGQDNSTFAIIEGPNVPTKKTSGVMICPPLFHEMYKTHFIQRKISELITDAGLACVRFDYSGTGDSLGSCDKIRLSDWYQDLVATREKLLNHTGVNELVVVAFRFSCAMVMQSKVFDNDQLVFIDPCFSGSDYLSQLESTQSKLIESHSLLGSAEKANLKVTELLGEPRNSTLMDDISKLAVAPAEVSSKRIQKMETDVDWLSANLRLVISPDVITFILDSIRR